MHQEKDVSSALAKIVETFQSYERRDQATMQRMEKTLARLNAEDRTETEQNKSPNHFLPPISQQRSSK